MAASKRALPPPLSFDCEPIPRMRCCDKRAIDLMRAGKPVVLIDTKVVQSASHWDIDYLRSRMGKSNTVYRSETPQFKYHDPLHNTGGYVFEEPTKKLEMTFDEFADGMAAAEAQGHKLYLQQGLNDTVGQDIVQDFLRFNWGWLRETTQALKWGDLTTNMLFVGMPGVITPLHFDEQQNFFAQISGNKQCILVDPEHYGRVYPYRLGHPCDRQSQVDLYDVDFEKFPKFRGVTGFETTLKPGEVLYIPKYWWHHIVTLDSVSISVNFWYKADTSPEAIGFPLTSTQKVAMTRNIERMLHTALGTPDEVADFMTMLYEGRYDSNHNHKTVPNNAPPMRQLSAAAPAPPSTSSAGRAQLPLAPSDPASTNTPPATGRS